MTVTCRDETSRWQGQSTIYYGRDLFGFGEMKLRGEVEICLWPEIPKAECEWAPRATGGNARGDRPGESVVLFLQREKFLGGVVARVYGIAASWETFE